LGEFMRAHPFATLVSLGGEGLVGTHLPMLWDPEPGPHGTLTGHIARPNPHGKGARDGVESLAIFTGAQAYISPGWYPSKREHGKVVPTWNYVAMHAYGALRIVDDAEWLRRVVTRLTELHESFSAVPWKVADAPDAFIDQMLKGIVGVELAITRLEGKWKLSQNRPEPDQAGTIAGLDARGDSDSAGVAAAMRAVRGR
ncbi:MAG: FMN-binding negative transcriptional regulator, partial [Candidatus Odyssella sp.]|nr:FMN-binding negative transcriptional regulator [Candidatus Odyssella sp.]